MDSQGISPPADSISTGLGEALPNPGTTCLRLLVYRRLPSKATNHFANYVDP